MTTTTPPRPGRRPIPPRRLEWLRTELQDWQQQGLLEPDDGAAILDRYSAAPTRRLSLGRLLLGLGAAFLGVGLIWLVASNLDQLSPLLRFGVVAAVWLALLVAGESLAARGGSRPVTAALRLAAALASGAVIFQAAQSLQAPAFGPGLVAAWAAGTLLHAYASGSRAPLLVGVPTTVVAWLWETLEGSHEELTLVVSLGVLCVAGVSAATLHGRRLPAFAQAWQVVGVGTGLVVLFGSAIPGPQADGLDGNATLVAGGVAATALALVATLRSTGTARLEPLGALLVVLASVGLLAWEAGTSSSDLAPADYAHALVGVGTYLLVAVGVAALGVLRERPVLTWLALAALVLFTTVQSFAVFAQIIQGAWLFVVLGVVLAATGFLADRARRGLVAQLDDRTPITGGTR